MQEHRWQCSAPRAPAPALLVSRGSRHRLPAAGLPGSPSRGRAMTPAASRILPEPGTLPPEKPAPMGSPLQQLSPAAWEERGVATPVPPQSLRPKAGTDLHCLHPPLVPLLVVDHRAVLARWLVPHTVVNHVLRRRQQQKRRFVVRSNKLKGLKNFASPANLDQPPKPLSPAYAMAAPTRAPPAQVSLCSNPAGTGTSFQLSLPSQAQRGSKKLPRPHPRPLHFHQAWCNL